MKKEKMNMRKTIFCALIMGTALCFSACGVNTDETPDSLILENPASGEMQGQEIDAAEENTETSAENENPGAVDEAGVNSGSETDSDVIGTDTSVTVVMKTEDNTELTTEDGTVYYVIGSSYPVVSIAGNEAAAEKINEDLYSRVSDFKAGANIQAETAKEDFEYMLSDMESDYTPIAYSSELSFTVTRADSNVISFTENGYDYMGGAHGMPYTTGINYDTKTGELITFTDLSDHPDAFRADTLAYNQALAQTEYYSTQMFSQDDITNGTLEQVLYSDGAWYLSTSGLIFMSAPYALAPYAAGTLEFTIPYNDLTNMGFKEQYTYTGRQIVKLFESGVYNTDLNGDGNEDSVIYSNEWLQNASSGLDSLMHLTINGVDFSDNDAIKDKLLSSWPELCVYDLDVDDNYVELAFIYTVWTQDNAEDSAVSTQYSRFFRYTEDGSLIYLGRVKGDVTDPTVTFSASDIKDEDE